MGLYEPAAQGVHDGDAWVLKVPGGQVEHSGHPAKLNLPSGQVEQLVYWLNGVNFPATQGVHEGYLVSEL
jgi:hypothetical protein